MERPKVPAGLTNILAENPGVLKYFAELSPERQRSVIEIADKKTSPAEIRAFVRKMAGRGN